MMDDVILHNPRCSKSRGALELLRERGANVAVREYLSDSPSVEELREVVRMLGVRPIEIVRKAETPYTDLRLSEATPDDEVLAAMAEHPILIERPIVVIGGRAVIGRPPEKILELL
jgi:arsenate reductase